MLLAAKLAESSLTQVRGRTPVSASTSAGVRHTSSPRVTLAAASLRPWQPALAP